MADRTLIDPLSVLLVSAGRAHAWFTAAGITIERVMTDNGSCYKSFAWRDALATAGITHKRTRPYRG